MEEIIKTLYSLELCRLIVALVICAAVLLGVVLGYQIGKAKELCEKEAEQSPEDAYNEQLQRDVAFLKQYFKAKEQRK